MHWKEFRIRSAVWTVPSIYAGTAIAAGIVLPRLESRMWPDAGSALSVSSAIAIYSTVAAGTMALTAIVFSLTFVMVQFSATAYSPRLVLWLARDPWIAHALGVFSATFLYAIAALAWIDRGGSSLVPRASAITVLLLLIASVGMFIGIIQRIALLQIHRMLTFIGDQGRRVIASLYPRPHAMVTEEPFEVEAGWTPMQVLRHRGRPRAVQSIDTAELFRLACHAQALIEVTVAVGDTVMESTTLLRVFGATHLIDEQLLRRTIERGEQRTFDQDPKYAIRLLVDVAIRALSSAINDPTTAVQALDQIGDLLVRVGRRRLEMGTVRDVGGVPRVTIPFPTWDDFLRLAFAEIAAYGAASVQVTRRLHALIGDLVALLPDERRPALQVWLTHLERSVELNFVNPDDRAAASIGDRQGLGVSRRRSAA